MKNYLIYGFLFFVVFMIVAKMKRGKLTMFTDQDAKEAILNVKKTHGEETARIVEKIFRLETGHFKSQQYKLTGTAGMEIGKWGKYLPNASSMKTVTMQDADKTDGADTFYVWNPKDFAQLLANYIKRYNGNFARWNTTDPIKQEQYRAHVNSIKSRFV